MIISFEKEMADLEALVGYVPAKTRWNVIGVLMAVYGRGMAAERRRCLDIVARKAMNAAAVREEIERPVR